MLSCPASSPFWRRYCIGKGITCSNPPLIQECSPSPSSPIQLAIYSGAFFSHSIVVFWRVTDELSSRHGGLLLSKQRGKEIFRLLPELETLVCVEDQRLHECLGLLTTRFPNGFDGQA